MIKWRLSENGAILIYLILVSGIAGILLAWRMAPKSASKIVVRYNGNAPDVEYGSDETGGKIRYKIDDAIMRIYANGKITVIAIPDYKNIEILP